MTIDDMKQRILKPTRGTLNAKTQTPSQAPTPTTSTRGSGGQTNGTLQSGSVAYQNQAPHGSTNATTVPSQPSLFGGLAPLRVPKPSEIFGIPHGIVRTSSNAPVQYLPPPPVVSPIPQLPPAGLLTAASATRQREHERRLRSLSVKMQRANQKRRMEAHTLPTANDTAEWIPLTQSHKSMTGTPMWGSVLSGLRRLYSGETPTLPPSDPNSAPRTETDVGVHREFDTDVVDALVYSIGRWLALDTDQLRNSPGLRTLVSRNIQWFRASPDWLKLTGLVLAKKLNQSLDCPKRSGDDSTQRMLLDATVNPDGSEATTILPGLSEVPIVPVLPMEVPPTKRQRRTSTPETASKAKTKAKVTKFPKDATPKSPAERRPKKVAKNSTPASPKRRRAAKRSPLHSLLTADPSTEVSVDTSNGVRDSGHASVPDDTLTHSSPALLIEEATVSFDPNHASTGPMMSPSRE